MRIGTPGERCCWRNYDSAEGLLAGGWSEIFYRRLTESVIRFIWWLKGGGVLKGTGWDMILEFDRLLKL